MDPMVLDAAGWAQIGAVINKLTVFVALMILGAFSALLSRAVIPSLVTTHEAVAGYGLHRRILTVLAIISFVLAIVQFVRVAIDVVAVLQPFYPRFGF